MIGGPPYTSMKHDGQPTYMYASKGLGTTEHDRLILATQVDSDNEFINSAGKIGILRPANELTLVFTAVTTVHETSNVVCEFKSQ